MDKKSAVTASRVAFTIAILWAALGLDSLARPYQDNRRDFVVLVPFTFTAIVLWLIGQMQSTDRDRLERVTFWALMIASCLRVLGRIGNVSHNALLEHLGFPAGPPL
jgi:hypothetical protein